MEQSILLDFRVLEKKKYNFLTEVLDVSQQLEEAIRRDDMVSVRMLVSLRQDPILHLAEVKDALEDRQQSLLGPDGERMKALLTGQPAQNAAEEPLAEQIASTRRLLERVLELDRRINLRLGGKSSYYAENR